MKTHRAKLCLIGTSILLVLLLSSCKVNFITTIENSGSGTYVQEIGFQGDEASMAGLGAGDENFCAAQNQELPPNTSIRQETRNETETWCIFESSFASLDALKTIYGMTDTRINDISLVDGKMNYDISLDLSGDSGASMGAEVFWIVKLPGTIIETNAAQQDGNTLTWTLVGGQVNDIRAVSEVGGFSLAGTIGYIIGGGAILCLCCFAPIILAGVVLLVLRKKKESVPDVTETASQSN
jgi:hypothetical protein